MATTTTTGKSTKARKSRKTVDLSTAQVVDGALSTPRSIREVIGQPKSKYSTNDLRVYRQQLEALPFHRIQEHCYELGIVPAMDKTQSIARLERAFVSEFQTNGKKLVEAPKLDHEKMSLRERAQSIMRRDR